MSNLDLPVIASGQNQKYQTSNDADNALDLALSDIETVDFTGGAVSLTLDQYVAAMVLKCINVGSALALTLYQSRKLSVIWNAGAHAVTVTRGSSTSVLVPGAIGIFYTDGSANGLLVIGVTGPTSGGGLGGAVAYAPSAGAQDPGGGITGFVAALGSGGTGRLHVTLAGDTTFAGLPAGVDGQQLFITVVAGNYTLTLTSAGSTTGAQMSGFGGGLNIGLLATAQLFYDGGLGTWQIVP